MNDNIAAQIQSFFDNVVSSTNEDIQKALDIRNVDTLYGIEQPYGKITLAPYTPDDKQRTFSFRKKVDIFGRTEYHLALSDLSTVEYEVYTLILKKDRTSQKVLLQSNLHRCEIEEPRYTQIVQEILEATIRTTVQVAQHVPIQADEKTLCSLIEKIFLKRHTNGLPLCYDQHPHDKYHTSVQNVPSSATLPHVRLIQKSDALDHQRTHYDIQVLDRNETPIYSIATSVEYCGHSEIRTTLDVSLRHHEKIVHVPEDQRPSVLETLNAGSMLIGLLQHMEELQRAQAAREQQEKEKKQTTTINTVSLALEDVKKRLAESSSPSM